MTRGIFRRDRFWVTDTEVSHGVIEHNKSLLCVCPVDSEYRFSFDDKCYELEGHIHPAECCRNVAESFQCMARAIPAATDVSAWFTQGTPGSRDGRITEETLQKCVIDIVKRYLTRATALEHLQNEIEYQKSLGRCPMCAARDGDEESDRGETRELEMKSSWGDEALVEEYAGKGAEEVGEKTVTRAVFDGLSSSAGEEASSL